MAAKPSCGFVLSAKRAGRYRWDRIAVDREGIGYCSAP